MKIKSGRAVARFIAALNCTFLLNLILNFVVLEKRNNNIIINYSISQFKFLMVANLKMGQIVVHVNGDLSSS